MKIKKCLLILVATFFFSFWSATSSFAAQKKDFIGIDYKYLDNESTTEETSLSDVYQKKLVREASLQLDYYIHLEGHLKNYESNVRVDTEERLTNLKRGEGSAWIPVFKYFYISASNEQSLQEYKVIDDAVLNFSETEKIMQTSQGLGVYIEEWNTRMGYSPSAKYSWEYTVESDLFNVFDQKVAFAIKVYEFVKKPVNTMGFFMDLYYKKMETTSIEGDFEGEISGNRQYYKLGYGFSKYSGLFVGGQNSKSYLKILQDGQTNGMTQDNVVNQWFYGLEVGFGGSFGLSAEKSLTRTENESLNDVYYSYRNYLEESTTFGIKVNKQLRIEMEVGKTIDERSSDLTVEGYEPTEYKLVDNLVGVTVRMQFGE